MPTRPVAPSGELLEDTRGENEGRRQPVQECDRRVEVDLLLVAIMRSRSHRMKRVLAHQIPKPIEFLLFVARHVLPTPVRLLCGSKEVHRVDEARSVLSWFRLCEELDQDAYMDLEVLDEHVLDGLLPLLSYRLDQRGRLAAKITNAVEHVEFVVEAVI